jgi:hypothetical protein
MTAKAKMVALLRHAAQSGPLDNVALERMAERALKLTEPVDVAKLRQRLADCLERIDEWKSASGLITSAGDPADIEPEHLEADLREREREAADLEALATARRDGLSWALETGLVDPWVRDLGGERDMTCKACESPYPHHDPDCRYVALRKLAELEPDDV